MAEQIGVDFQQFQELKTTDFQAASLCFARFKAGLERRMQWEDETLFPAFDHKLGTLAGNISARFRAEHNQIRSLLNAIEVKLAQGDTGTATEESDLEMSLGAHNHREHEAIYPVVHLGS